MDEVTVELSARESGVLGVNLQPVESKTLDSGLAKLSLAKSANVTSFVTCFDQNKTIDRLSVFHHV